MHDDPRIFLWAMLHSPEFQYCYIKLPVSIGFRWFKNYQKGWSGSISINFQPLGVYVPWSVRDAYFETLPADDPLRAEFDDIPF